MPSRATHDLPEVDPTIDKNSDFYKRNVLPVDHGYAWIICFAGFLAYFVFGVSNQTLVVLFVELIYYYDVTITVGSMVFVCSVFSVGVMSIVSTNILAPRFGERIVVAAAGVCSTFGTLGLSLSPNYGIFIFFSFIKGMATGAVLVPSISLIRLYFQNRRAIAQTIANIGQSVAVIIVPPVIRVVRREYGVSGTFMVIAGIELHMTIAGLLLRPVSAYKFRPRITTGKPQMMNLMVSMMSSDFNELKIRKAKLQNFRKKLALLAVVPMNIDIKRRLTGGKLFKPDFDNSQADVGGQSIYPKRALSNLTTDTEISNRSSIQSSKFFFEGTDEYSTVKSMTAKVKEIRFRRHWLYRMALISTIPGSANMYIRNYVPTIMTSQGVTLDQSALLLTIVGSVDLVSRLCVGIFEDLHIVTALQLIIITQLCLAVVCHAIRFFTSYNMLILYSIFLGCFIGTRISVMPLLAIEIVGIERMPKALSYISTVAALSYAVMNPIFGYTAEKYDNFIVVMHLLGVLFTISSFIMLFVPPVVDLCIKYKYKDDEDTDSNASVLTNFKLDAAVKLKEFFSHIETDAVGKSDLTVSVLTDSSSSDECLPSSSVDPKVSRKHDSTKTLEHRNKVLGKIIHKRLFSTYSLTTEV